MHIGLYNGCKCVCVCFPYVICWCVVMQKDDTSLLRQDEASRLVVDDDNDVRQHEKPADSSSNSHPTFYRPFLDVEDNSSPPEKLCKVSVGEVETGVHSVPLHTVPLSNSQSDGSVSEDGGSHCETGESDERRPCEGECRELRDDDVGPDKRLHAALGLISLADFSSDVAQVQPQSGTNTTTENCSDGEISQTS